MNNKTAIEGAVPLYSYRCNGCGHEFETLVSSSDVPECPSCQGKELQRLLSAPQAPGKSGEVLGALRKQAAREGHFSNYSRSELKRRR